MVEEGKSILRASKETGLSYNAVHEIVYGKKCPGGTQYPWKDDPQAHKCSIRKSAKTLKIKVHHDTNLGPFRTTTSSQSNIYLKS